MNAKPHTHEIRISRQYNRSGGWRINYGDTTVKMFNWPHFINKEKALRRKVAKAIRRHDRGSLRAQAGVDRIALLEQEANEQLGHMKQYTQPQLGSYFVAAEAWGSDLLDAS